MRPEPGQVLHFSEDPGIIRFDPHVARTARQPEPDAHRHPVRLPPARGRVHPVRRTRARAHVATETVRPLGPAEPVGDLLALHEEAGIQLRVLPALPPFWSAVIASTLGFSGIRLR
jgi:hypothetical protein